MNLIAMSLLIVALITDVMSLVLAIRRIIKGFGPSGIPLLPLFVYYILTEWLNQSFIFGTPLWAFMFFTAFHVFCQFLIPLAFRLGVKPKIK
jgi:hypothetical protein